MLAAATSFFSRSAISQSYNVGTSANGSRSSTPGPGGFSSNQTAISQPSIHVGLWRVQSATHKVTNKRASIWTFDKRGPEMERLPQLSKDRTLEVLKAEASALGRLRHPSILEMVEPLEETRSELVFVTEPILSSLDLAIPKSARSIPIVELDEIEIQKGILQLSKGLSFLHSSAQLVHSNICPESIIINGSGDWKISGLGLTIPLLGQGGAPTRWEFPTFDGRAPAYIQRSFDYMAPEYALDESLQTASDMYSLGCLIYAVHSKGVPPFTTHGSLGALRDNAGKPIPGLDRLDGDLQALLRSLVTRHAAGRPTPSTLPAHPFFSSLPISTLNFLDRSNFTTKTREEKISFMKGLAGVLSKFSEGLRTRKILPSLLEEMKDIHLLPYILPNVFSISTSLSAAQFANLVLPSLKPLFVIKEPPQNMLTLLDNLSMLQEKTEKVVFREQVLPLVYNALESEHVAVQEQALKVIPSLCETIDYAEVQGVLFPRLALLFTKTRILSVKVAALMTFLPMIQTLDQSSLTQKLVPLLSKIRTKEPAVMMATLSVQEAMGFKVDREAVATLVLPQLWSLSMGPLLNLEQFKRFMAVIKKLGDRVEKEHDQFLRDSQRIEDRSAMAANNQGGAQSFSGTVDFESLVGGAQGSVKADTAMDKNKDWDDDIWGSIFNNNATTPPLQSPAIAPTTLAAQAQSPTLSYQSQINVSQARPSRLGAGSSLNTVTAPRERRSFTHNSSQSLSVTPLPISPPPFQPQHYNSPTATTTNMPSQGPRQALNSLTTPVLQAQKQTFNFPTTTTPQAPKPNYNISHLAPQAPSLFPSPPHSLPPPNYNMPPLVSQSSSILPASRPPPPAMGGLLAPTKANTSWNNSSQKPSQSDWGDFDPLA